MIWLLVGLIAAATAAFLLYLFVFRWRQMARLGNVEVPCDTVVELPAGKIVVYYQDGFRWRYSEPPRPWSGFSVLISDEGDGRRIDLGPPPKQATIKHAGTNRVPYGTMTLPQAGRYRIVSQVDADATEPAITFG